MERTNAVEDVVDVKVFLPAIVLLVACKGGDDQLGARVRGYCSNLASETRDAAAEMKKISIHLDSLEVSARAQAEAEIMTHPSSADFGVRLARTHALLGRFNFCVNVRAADDATAKRLETRGAMALTTVRGNPLDHERPDYHVTLKALEDLAAAVDETNSLPLLK